LKGHTDRVNSVCFSADGKTLASASSDQTVKVWDAGSGQQVFTLRVQTGPVTSVCVSADGKVLATASVSAVKVWDARSGQQTFTLQGYTGPESVCFSPDGKRFAIAFGVVKLWDTTTWKEVLTLKGAGGSVWFSPDGKSLVSVSSRYDEPKKEFHREVKVW